MALSISQITAISYNAVLNTMRKAENQWAESSLMKEYEKQGFVKRVPGGPKISAALDYRRNPGAGFQATDLDPLSLGKTEVVTEAEYDPAQIGIPVVWSKGDEAKNPSQNQKVALAKQLMENAVNSHDDLVEQALFAVSTSGFYGFQTLIPDSGQGTVGGINAATETFWRNYSSTYASAGTDIKAKMTLAWNTCTRGSGSPLMPTLIVSDAETQSTYEAQEQSLQRFVDTQDLKGGFKTLAFKTGRYVFSPYGGTRIYFLNPKVVQLIAFTGAFREKGETQELEGGRGFRFEIFSMVQQVQKNRVRTAVLTEV
jgi:hypothetical protein